MRRRIRALLEEKTQPAPLLPFAGNHSETMPRGLPYSLADYLELMDWTGRAMRDDKRGFIPDKQPPILVRLGLKSNAWVAMTHAFENLFHDLVGCPERVEAVVAARAQHWAQGIRHCRQYLAP